MRVGTKSLTIITLFTILLLGNASFILLYNEEKQINQQLYKQVPEMIKDSYKTACMDGLLAFSFLPKQDITNACEVEARDYVAPIKALFELNGLD